MKKKLAILRISAILNPVSERKNNMKNEKMIDRIDQHLGGLLTELRSEQTVLVSCCGCNHEEHITREAADEWTDTDWFMCQECE